MGMYEEDSIKNHTHIATLAMNTHNHSASTTVGNHTHTIAHTHSVYHDHGAASTGSHAHTNRSSSYANANYSAYYGGNGHSTSPHYTDQASTSVTPSINLPGIGITVTSGGSSAASTGNPSSSSGSTTINGTVSTGSVSISTVGYGENKVKSFYASFIIRWRTQRSVEFLATNSSMKDAGSMVYSGVDPDSNGFDEDGNLVMGGGHVYLIVDYPELWEDSSTPRSNFIIGCDVVGTGAPDGIHFKTKDSSGITDVPDGSVTNVKIANSAVSQAKLKTSTSSVSVAIPVSVVVSGDILLPGGEYGFWPQDHFQINEAFTTLEVVFHSNEAGANSSYLTHLSYKLQDSISNNNYYVRQRYVTSSGEVYWYFFLKEKSTGSIVASYQSPDHPCFGNGGDPDTVPHPFMNIGIVNNSGNFIAYSIDDYDIIVVNPLLDQAKEIFLRAKELNKDPLSIVMEEYEVIDIASPMYPEYDGGPGYFDIPVTIGLDETESFPFNDSKEAKPLKRILTRPDYIKVQKLIKL